MYRSGSNIEICLISGLSLFCMTGYYDRKIAWYSQEWHSKSPNYTPLYQTAQKKTEWPVLIPPYFLCSMTWGQIDGGSNSIQIRSHSRQFSRLRKKIIQNCEDKRQISSYSKSFYKSEMAQKKKFWFLILDFQSYCRWTLKNCNNLKSIKECHWRSIGTFFFLYFSHMEASQFKTKPFLRSNPISNQWERKLLWHLFQCKRSKNFKYFPITLWWKHDL